jgi:hypothetical protein
LTTIGVELAVIVAVADPASGVAGVMDGCCAIALPAPKASVIAYIANLFISNNLSLSVVVCDSSPILSQNVKAQDACSTGDLTPLHFGGRLIF